MKIKKIENNLHVFDLEEFDLEEILECGQCFRWKKIDSYCFFGIAKKKCLKISQNENSVVFENTSIEDFESIWREYFDLNTNYYKIKAQLSTVHPNLKAATDFCKGIRILNQDPWETLCSFIISQNNNIPRIAAIVSRLCENFGQKIDNLNFDFPSPDVISKVCLEDLDVLKAGFRSKYILDAAKKIASGEVDFGKLSNLSIDQAQQNLIKINGVGPKVAQCTLLYGFHRFQAFPIDVWIKKAMKFLFDDVDPSLFGQNAGVAQQYIFHYSRMNKQLFEQLN